MPPTAQLAARMKYLFTSEAFFAVVATPFFAAYWSGTGGAVDWSARVPPLVLVCYLLAQGALYWALKYRQYSQGAALPVWFPGLFRFFRGSNVVSLAVTAVALAIAASRGADTIDLAWASGLWVFALLEHVNYYHLQLMYDTRSALRRLRLTRRLRTPMLADDLRSAVKPGSVTA